MQSIFSFNWKQFLRPAAAGAALVLGMTAFGSVTPAFAASTDRTVSSDEFAAPLYRVLKNNYDLNGDGKLTVGELQSITSLDLSDSGLSSLDGIEYLTGLTYLDLSENNLTTLKDLENYYTKGETLSPETRVLLGDVNTPDEAFLALYGMAGSIVEMPPAVEPGDRRDGTYYLDRKVSYNRGV